MQFIKSHKLLSAAVVVVLLLGVVVVGFASMNKISPIGWGWHGDYLAANGVAIGGYDTVAYHTENRAVMGDATYSHEWKGVKWHFVSADNLAMFQTEPDKYAPQLGGFCVQAVCNGLTAVSDPKSFLVQDGKLYLFNNEDIKAGVLAKLSDGALATADQKWSQHRAN